MRPVHILEYNRKGTSQMEEIIKIFPPKLGESIRKSGIFTLSPEEIRVRVNMPFMVCTGNGDYFLAEDGLLRTPNESCHRVSRQEMDQICMRMADYSPYAHEEELRQGYLTLAGGHRVGVAGQVLVENKKIVRMSRISFLNIRIAGARQGTGQWLLPFLFQGGQFQNTLIMSPPGVGKTTLLRELVRLLSDGSGSAAGMKVGLVDERFELAGSRNGVPQLDVGVRTDVMEGCPKHQAIEMLLRTMSPQLIAVDEVGDEEDRKALHHAMYCGCRILATLHCDSLEELKRKPGWGTILQFGFFQRFLVLECSEARRRAVVFDGDGRLMNPGREEQTC